MIRSTFLNRTFGACVTLALMSSGAIASDDARDQIVRDAELPSGTFNDPPLWTPSAPFQNPYSEEKRVLGKILFWDEQLSSDSTISCGTCHIPGSGGADPRPGAHPGFDELFGTDDDVHGSPGVSSSDAMGNFLNSTYFGLEPQIGGRFAQTNLMAMFAPGLFWDGRAELDFVDPESGQLVFQSGVGGLEIQALAPIMNTVEMSYEGRTWDDVRNKLDRVRPLALSDSIPPDALAAIEANPSYGALFEAAFGDPYISAVRIAYALATYQRDLVPNQTPWDLWNDGDSGAMTAQQIAGYTAFRGSSCAGCHSAPAFSNFDFMVDGVRPPAEDLGRMEVTGRSADRGKFKTASIRNAGVRNRLMHNGGLADMDDIFDFYGHRNGLVPDSDNLHFLVQVPITFSAQDEVAVRDFLVNGLTDPRVANETYPFDRPRLNEEQPISNPEIVGAGEAGSGGIIPKMYATSPPNIGNADFRIGVDFALGGAQAWVAVSSNPPVGGVVSPDELIGPISLSGMGNGSGFGTLLYPIADDPSLDGTTKYMQWVITDPAGSDGFARSEAARLDFFCTRQTPCTIACVADFNADGLSDFFDVSAFLGAFSAGSSAADLTGDGMFDFFDVSAFLSAFGAGCP